MAQNILRSFQNSTWTLNVSEHAVRAFLTHVVVSRDGHGGSGAGTLLGEVVAEFEDAGVVLQHGGDLHLNRVSQLLPLQRTGEEKAVSEKVTLNLNPLTNTWYNKCHKIY